MSEPPNTRKQNSTLQENEQIYESVFQLKQRKFNNSIAKQRGEDLDLWQLEVDTSVMLTVLSVHGLVYQTSPLLVFHMKVI